VISRPTVSAYRLVEVPELGYRLIPIGDQ
jgi:hypothetical protein